MTDETEKNEAIHVATLIRLNVTTTALELACHDMGEMFSNAETGEDRDRYAKTLILMRSALAIARGVHTDVPAPLRDRSTWGLMHHPDRLTHFLSIPAA